MKIGRIMIRGVKLSYEPVIYNPHTLSPLVPHTNKKYVGCFIDIGMRNMALRFSEYDPQDKQIKGVMCMKFDFDLSKGSKSRKLGLDARPDVGKESDKYAQLTQQFTKLGNSFYTCHYIVMEKQLGTATANLESSMYTLGLLSSIIMDKGSRPLIVMLDSRVKTKMLSMPRGSDPKTWCLSKSINILGNNIGEYDEILKHKLPNMPITGPNKSYDISDTICYCEVWWRHYVDKGRIIVPC
jgi:hypothetical protein